MSDHHNTSLHEAFAYCEQFARRGDSDRAMAALFAPKGKRRDVFALLAFALELAKTRESVSEPMLGEIRLQWWRETVDEIYTEGPVRRHNVARALEDVVRRYNLPREAFDALIDARAFDLYAAPMANLTAIDAYADATSGAVAELSARILCDTLVTDEILSIACTAGSAYGLAGLLRALPFQVGRRQAFLPADLLAEQGVAVEAVFAGKMAPGVGRVVEAAAIAATNKYQEARALVRSAPPSIFPALAPAALAPAYLKEVRRRDNAFRIALGGREDLAKRLRFVWATARGRI